MMCKERKAQKDKFDQDNAEQMTDDEYRRYYGRGREKPKEDKDENKTVFEKDFARF